MASVAKVKWIRVANESSHSSARLVLENAERTEAIDCDFGAVIHAPAQNFTNRSYGGCLEYAKAKNVPELVSSVHVFVKRVGCFYESAEMHPNAEVVAKSGYVAPLLNAVENEPPVQWFAVSYHRILPTEVIQLTADQQQLVPVPGLSNRFLLTKDSKQYLVKSISSDGTQRKCLVEKLVHEVAVSVAVHVASSKVQPAVLGMRTELAAFAASKTERFYRCILHVEYAVEGLVSYDLSSYAQAVDGRLMLGTANKEVYRGRVLKRIPGSDKYSAVDAVKTVVKIVGCNVSDRHFEGQGVGTIPLKSFEQRRGEQDDVRQEINILGSISAYLPPDKVLRVNAVLTDLQPSRKQCHLYLCFPYYPKLSVRSLLNQKKMENDYASRESLARFIVHDVAQALQRMHANHMVHLDICPENIVINNAFQCVLIEFGQARTDDNSVNLNQLAVRPHFHSPDWLGKWMVRVNVPLQWEDLIKLDSWYLGITLFILLFRATPAALSFSDEEVVKEIPLGGAPAGLSDTDRQTFHWFICQGRILDLLTKSHYFSPDAMSLLRGLLSSAPSSRLNMTDVLQHPWLAQLDESSRPQSFGDADWRSVVKHRFESTGLVSKTSSVQTQQPLSLHQAVQQDDAASIKTMLSDINLNINLQDEEGRTALHWSCLKGSEDISQLMISDLRMDLNIADKDGRTALHLASMSNHVTVMRMLLPIGDNAAKPSREVNRVHDLRNAAVLGVAADVQTLLEDAEVRARVDEADQNSSTALQLAARQGHVSVLQRLLPWANANIQDHTGMTALHLASSNGHQSAVATLLQDESIDVNLRDRNQHTALHLAATGGHDGATAFLLTHAGMDPNVVHTDGRTALHFAVLSGSLATVRALLADPRVKANIRDQSGRTALHYAWLESRLDIFVYLAQHDRGATSEPDSEGRTVLHHASYEGNYQMVALLHRLIAVDSRDQDNRTALMWASIGGHVDVVDLLLRGDSQRGIPPADINAQDTGGVVALHYACVNGHTAVVRRLLDDERIEADVQDSIGNNALHWTIASNHGCVVEIVEMLLAHQRLLLVNTATNVSIHRSLSVNTATNDGRTPLYLASALGHTAVVQALLAIPELDFAARTQDGATALQAAVANGHTDIAALLEAAILQRQLKAAEKNEAALSVSNSPTRSTDR